MRILLHICCGPCAIYIVKKLTASNNSVEGFFYNPNIHPASEYLKRKKAVEEVSRSMGFKVHFTSDFYFEDFFRRITFHEGKERCALCWSLRIGEAAEYASKNGFEGFTTTLLISPYQDHERLKAIAKEASERYSVKFIYEDFRDGFRESHRISKEMGLYHQNYCGCIYSERERQKERIGKR